MIKKAFFFLFLLVFFACLAVYWQFSQALHSKLLFNDGNKTHLLTVKSGSSISSFSKQLESKGWISDRFWLRNYGRLFPQQANIKAGTYNIDIDTSVLELLTQVVQGKEHQFTVTFIEGTRFSDALIAMQSHPYIERQTSNKTLTQIAETIGITNIIEGNPEGWLFPDTYAFTAGTSDITLLKRAYEKIQTKLATLWHQRMTGLPYETPYQALIMASIIEKETSYIPEQGLIAGVFINRLNKNMRLQTDPTVIYGLGDRYQGNITRAHLREKTAYNTYRINGLPPTPIAMVGLSALKAALNPEDTDYYYFVSQGNGQHTFSRTLKEHNLAVRAYLKNIRNKGKESAEN